MTVSLAPERLRGGCMTASGVMFYPLTPRREDIRVWDIAHHLSAINRFTGATRFPYSVAQHSVLCSRWMFSQDHDATRALYGLMHDASEYILSDVPSPLKHLESFAAYLAAESLLQQMIYEVIGLEPNSEPSDLKVIDRRMLRTEQAVLMPPAAPGEDRSDQPVIADLLIERWTFEHARTEFLVQFQFLKSALTG